MDDLKEKINKWQGEIEKIVARQNEFNRKADDKINSLQARIDAAKSELSRLENEKIAEAVRDIYGSVTLDTLEDFKLNMMVLMEKKSALGDTDETSLTQEYNT